METEGSIQRANCANTEGLFRIIQSIPSPKAEPFKRWLAQVGYERVKEIENPELASARAYWRKLKHRLVAECSEAVTFCHGLKLHAEAANT